MSNPLGVALLLGMILFGGSGCARQSVENSTVAQSASQDTSAAKVPDAHSPEVVSADPSWFACRKNTDCKVVKGPCSEPQAISIRFETDFTVYRQRMEQLVDCVQNAKPLASNPPQCLKNRCALQP